MACPKNSILYNGSSCACPAGYFLNRTTNSCSLFRWSSSDIVMNSGVDFYAVSFPSDIFPFESLKKFAQSQAIFLEATAVMLLCWLVFCCLLRFKKLGDGRSPWFQMRWWISRFDVCFATRHWLDDQKLLVKRKTELGGTFSIASFILFTGLLSALLYQVISKRNFEVHNVRAANAPDLAEFSNDMEFNITTVSSMSCSNLHHPSTIVSGSSGFIDRKVTALSDVLNYSCHNTSLGPIVAFSCIKCRIIQDFMSISWQFVDLPNSPATSVGFQFNLTARSHSNRRHVSFVNGNLKNGSNKDDRPVTFRGTEENILLFNLFPRIYHNLHDLRLIQPLFHDFIPGSSFTETSQLQASLQRSNDGLVNTTLYISYLSSYIIEIQNRSVMGLVGFLADLGGLYCFSVGIFFYLLVQLEYRIKKLRNEDSILRSIRNRRKAQDRWDKLRKYVMFTWGASTLDETYRDSKQETSCSSFLNPSSHVDGSARGVGSSKINRLQTVANNKASLLTEKPSKHDVVGSTNGKEKQSVGLHDSVSPNHHESCPTDDIIPPLPPLLEFKEGSEVELSDIQKNFQRLYDYNSMLREKLVATQSLIRNLAAKPSLGSNS